MLVITQAALAASGRRALHIRVGNFGMLYGVLLIVVGIATAAVHRMHFLGGRPPPVPQLLLVWLAPIYLGMFYDLFKHRLVHPAYVLGVLAIVYLKFFRVPLFKSDAWQDFAAWLTTFYV